MKVVVHIEMDMEEAGYKVNSIRPQWELSAVLRGLASEVDVSEPLSPGAGDDLTDSKWRRVGYWRVEE